jgi:histidyl-tRNA synthetase
VNNRKVLNGLMNRLFAGRAAALSEEERARLVVLFLRVLDKHDALGPEGVLDELARAPRDAFDEALGLAPDEVAAVARFLAIGGESGADDAAVLEALVGAVGADPQGAEGVQELRELVSHLAALGLADADIRIAPTIARGLDYYTGVVMETTLHDAPALGSVMSGGRYDGLVARFSANPIPAVGASIGLDRLFTAMKTLGLVPETATTTDVLVTVMEPDHLADYLGIAARLRAAGWNTDLYYGANTSFKQQMRYALRKGVRFLVIRGGDERAAGTVQLKDLVARRQEPVALDAAPDRLRGWRDEPLA